MKQTAFEGFEQLKRVAATWPTMKKYLQAQGLSWYNDPLKNGYASIKVPRATPTQHEQLANMAHAVKVMPWDGTRRYVVRKP